MTVRYRLEDSVRIGYNQPDWLDRHRVDIPIYNDFERFVNILEQNEDFIKVTIFLKDGEILVCWLVKRCQFPLELHNEEELYDGRFNSRKVDNAHRKNIQIVTEFPKILDSNTIYFLKTDDPKLIDIYYTNNDVSTLYEVTNKSEKNNYILALIDSYLLV